MTGQKEGTTFLIVRSWIIGQKEGITLLVIELDLAFILDSHTTARYWFGRERIQIG